MSFTLRGSGDFTIILIRQRPVPLLCLGRKYNIMVGYQFVGCGERKDMHFPMKDERGVFQAGRFFCVLYMFSYLNLCHLRIKKHAPAHGHHVMLRR